MCLILLSLCASVILPNNAQELTSLEAQPVTETSNDNGVNWDSTRPPVTLTIRNGRVDNSDRAAKKNSDLPVFYPNQWHPILMPIGFNRDGVSTNYPTENERFVSNQFLPTYLRRPDSEANNTVPYNFPQFVERNQYSSVTLPLAPLFYYQTQSNSTSDSLTASDDQKYIETIPNESYQTNTDNIKLMDLYRNSQRYLSPFVSEYYPAQPNSFSSDKNLVNTNNKEVTSTAVIEPISSDPASSDARVQYSKTLQNEEHSLVQERFQPVDTFRGNRGFLPPIVPAYFPPYPFLPFPRDGFLPPMIPYPSNDRNFDRELGSEIEDRDPETSQKRVVSEDIPDHIAESIQSETSTSVVPSDQLPVPAGGYSFGLLPPHILPPFIPNTPIAGGFPLNPVPLPEPASIPRENVVIPDGVPPLRPIPSGLLPDVPVPQTSYLQPEAQTKLLTDPQVNPEEIISSEKPNTEKIPYEFGFDMNDGKGNDQHRKEVSDTSGVVTGSYGYRDAFGVYRLVNYIADKDGFRAFIKSNEPGVASSGSANVVVLAEQPPPRAIAEGLKGNEPEIIVVPDPSTDLLPPSSIAETK